MDNKIKLIADTFGREKFKFDEPVSDHTALSVGGPARLFFVAVTPREIIRIVTESRRLKLPFLIFGTGTKMMISDLGFNGLVIKNRTKNINTLSVKGKATRFGIGVEEALVEVESGVSINKFCEYLESQGLASSQFLRLPGSIGGNLFLSSFLQTKAKSIKVLDLVSEVDEIAVRDLSPKKHIILSAVFRIKAKSI